MRSRIAKLMIAVAIVAMAVPAFAAVERIEVGGDLDVRGVLRNNYLLQQEMDVKDTSFIYMGTRVYVAAELTDGVSAMVRLINERDFGNDYLREVEGSIILDIAYIKVTDMMVPGLDVTVGRQELQIGDGLVVGSRYRALDYAGADIGTALLDMGKQKAFDAIRADYAVIGMPITFTGFNAKINESYGAGLGILPLHEDVNLWGVSMKYYEEGLFSVEPYYTYVRMQHTDDFGLMTLGARATFMPMENLLLTGELARQHGDASVVGTHPVFGMAGYENADFKGWAGLIGAEFHVETDMSPVLKAGYAIFSGQDSDSDINGWVPVFPSNVASRVGKVAYANLFPAGEGIGTGIIEGATGLQVFNLGAAVTPVENVTLGLDWFNLRATDTPAGTSKVYGNEVDLCLKFQYTEDLAFGLDYGILLTGSLSEEIGLDDNPWQLMASMSVAF